jgi:hypothetical protein
MTDTRFSTVYDELDQLIDTVDIDGVGDIETLLMFLFARPVGVNHAWDDAGAADLEVTLAGNDQSVRTVHEFPMSVLEFVRSCAETVADLGPYVDDAGVPAEEAPDVRAMSDDDLTTALQRTLGKVRVYNLMYPDDED